MPVLSDLALLVESVRALLPALVSLEAVPLLLCFTGCFEFVDHLQPLFEHRLATVLLKEL